MSPSSTPLEWDFTAAIDLLRSEDYSPIQSIVGGSSLVAHGLEAQSSLEEDEGLEDASDTPTSLGNFSRVFSSLHLSPNGSDSPFVRTDGGVLSNRLASPPLVTDPNISSDPGFLDQFIESRGKPTQRSTNRIDALKPFKGASAVLKKAEGPLVSKLEREPQPKGALNTERDRASLARGAIIRAYLEETPTKPARRSGLIATGVSTLNLSPPKTRREDLHRSTSQDLPMQHFVNSAVDYHSDGAAPFGTDFENSVTKDCLADSLTPTLTTNRLLKTSKSRDSTYERWLFTPATLAPGRSQEKPKSRRDVLLTPQTRSSQDKLVDLLNLLLKTFPEDHATLSRPWLPVGLQSLPQESDESKEIHVFVDISNILIGFHDAIKAHRGLPKEMRIPRQRLSFRRLSLFLERGRPAAKRVLVGSDDIESVQEARELGYEVHILERVAKPKASPHQKLQLSRRSRIPTPQSSSSDDPLSAYPLSVPSAPGPAIRRVEQGVDELLHLKMSQSLLDARVPGTMVLVTGDAAKAEHSDGFLAMVERALERGWSVEVIAFAANMSRAYAEAEWSERFKEKWRAVALDEVAELLREERG